MKLTLMKKQTMKKMLKARSICWVVFSNQGMQVSTPSLIGRFTVYMRSRRRTHLEASMKQITRDEMDKIKTRHTSILPVPVCPDISSPAQSFASDMKSPSCAASGFCPCSIDQFSSSLLCHHPHLQTHLLVPILLLLYLRVAVVFHNLSRSFYHQLVINQFLTSGPAIMFECKKYIKIHIKT